MLEILISSSYWFLTSVVISLIAVSGLYSLSSVITKICPRQRTQHVHYNGVRIVIVESTPSCSVAINELMQYSPTFVGFDCEWKANQRRGEGNKICLIQIAHERIILLIRVHLFCDAIPADLIAFLQNVNIIKCGVGIYGDAHKLKKDYQLQVHGCVDLNSINTGVDDMAMQQQSQSVMGLERFAATLLGQSMPYKHSVDHCEWEQTALSTEQVYYAADDAYVAYTLFAHIMRTQYDSPDNILECLYGNIDTHLRGHCSQATKKRQKQRMRAATKSDLVQLDDCLMTHGMLACQSQNGKLLTFITRKSDRDWYHIDDEANYDIIRECIAQICEQRNRNRKQHNAKYKASMTDFWGHRKIEFAEKWRLNFIENMSPKFINEKCPTFEITIDEANNLKNVNIRKWKHKILDVQGSVLTRTNRKFCDDLLSNDEQKASEEQVLAVRIRNTAIQLLADTQRLDVFLDDNVRENKVDRCWIVWTPFARMECVGCQHETGAAAAAAVELKPFDVFCADYYRLICEQCDGDLQNDFGMQWSVPLCTQCCQRAYQIQTEFECCLFERYTNLCDVVADIDDRAAYTAALCLSQASHRCPLSETQQNERVQKILQHHKEMDEAIYIKPWHCNQEIGVDWFHVNEFNYVVIKEYIESLLAKYRRRHRKILCAAFRRRELQFIELWIDNFRIKMNIDSCTLKPPFVIQQ